MSERWAHGRTGGGPAVIQAPAILDLLGQSQRFPAISIAARGVSSDDTKAPVTVRHELGLPLFTAILPEAYHEHPRPISEYQGLLSVSFL